MAKQGKKKASEKRTSKEAVVPKKSKPENWFGTGYDAVKEAEQEQELAKEARSYGPRRFWMPPGASTFITFLDDGPFTYREHQVKIGDEFRNWFTCLASTGKRCPLCEAGQRASFVGAYSVLDHSKYTDKKDVVHQHERRLYIAKTKTLALLQELSSEYDGLTGCMFKVTRSKEDKSPNVGDILIFKKKYNPSKEKSLKGLELDAYDYAEVCAPKEVAVLAKLLGKAAVGEDEDSIGGSKSKAAASDSDSDVPF
jgi:hypothetical protein